MPLVRWEPFKDVEHFFEEEWPRMPAVKVGWDLAVDLYEENGNIVAKMQLPGVDAEKVDVSVEDQYLKVSGSREEEKEEKKKNYYSKEIRRGSFERMVRLPKPVVAEKVTADYKDGVLVVVLPKKTEPKGSKIKVRAAGSR